MELLVDIIIGIISAGIKACCMIGIFKDVEFVDSNDSCFDLKENFNHYEDDKKIIWYSDGRSTDE